MASNPGLGRCSGSRSAKSFPGLHPERIHSDRIPAFCVETLVRSEARSKATSQPDTLPGRHHMLLLFRALGARRFVYHWHPGSKFASFSRSSLSLRMKTCVVDFLAPVNLRRSPYGACWDPFHEALRCYMPHSWCQEYVVHQLGGEGLRIMKPPRRGSCCFDMCAWLNHDTGLGK